MSGETVVSLVRSPDTDENNFISKKAHDRKKKQCSKYGNVTRTV